LNKKVLLVVMVFVMLVGLVSTTNVFVGKTKAASSSIVISEVVTGSTASASDEYVELFNRSGSPVDLNGWSLKYQGGASGTGTWTIYYQWTTSTKIPAYGHYLLAGTGYNGAKDATLSSGISEVGAVSIWNGSTQVDTLGWGAMTGHFERAEGGVPVASSGLIRGQVIERKVGYPSWNGQDTDNNVNDFLVSTSTDGSDRHPQTLSSPTTPPVPDTPSVPDNSNLLLGNPSNAVHNTSYPNNYLMDQTYYVISYNRDRGEPNWVSWYLGSSTLGSTDRTNTFRADTSLPSGWYQVQPTDYSYSGFDKGHNCPSGDRTSSYEANSSTFLMTNMIPQAPNNNRVTWENFESYLRSLVQEGYEVYIVMGSYGTGGTGSNGYATTIANGHVTVPSYIWKVAVVLPNGDNDLSRINTNTRVIAIDTPNTNSVNSDWRKYLVSVDDIEKATGYDLLSNVPKSIQDVIEARVDSGN
jgi:endonuclease G